MQGSRAETAGSPLKSDTPVQFLKGIGPRRAEIFAKNGIHTVADLLEYAPFRYEDRTRFRSLRDLRPGETALVRCEVRSLGHHWTKRRGFNVLELMVRDGTGSSVVKFFNQPYLRNVFRAGMRLVLYGPVSRDEFAGGRSTLLNPEFEILDAGEEEALHAGRVVPIYRRLGTVTGRALRSLLHHVIARMPADLPDLLPSDVRRRLKLLPRARALEALHFPVLHGSTPEERGRELDALSAGLSAAHKRFIFEELYEFQIGVRMVRERRSRARKEHRIRVGAQARESVKKILPFHPTAAQKRVLKEIVDDMRSDRPMHRLLQGDVGSGKTIVAAQAAVLAADNGFQTAIMAPTEILAEQHFLYFRRLFAPIGLEVGLLKSGLRAKARRETLAGLREGRTQVAIGTHALFQEEVGFRSLALAIIDEQHRFGVVQRSLLRGKGLSPDLLVMTATPIPRSLALTLYGDLDVSVLDELPPGRTPVATQWISEAQRERAYDEVRRTVSAGHQVYVVYPLVAESEKSDLRAATDMARHLSERVFPDLEIGLLHGKMKGDEKERVMGRFASGEIQVLVATTVIEVGVDVPNATLMVVEHAERFGLAQLHQLRGRVGRGRARSQCVLIANPGDSPQAKRRLETLCQTNDGFRIAEVDLELRGPGEIAGTRQSGVPVFKFASLVRDRQALEMAREEADRFVERIHERPDEEYIRILEHIRRRWRVRRQTALAE